MALRRSSTTRGVRGALGGLGVTRRGGANHPVGRHPACQCTDVAIFEGPLGPEGDLDGLFAIGGHGVALLTLDGPVDDSEVDLRLDPSRAGSSTVTFGEPVVTRTEPSTLRVLKE